MRRDACGALAELEGVEPRGRQRGPALVKRAFDIVAASALLLVFAPLGLILAALIRIESPGAALYRCRRVGQRGREFEMLKFRKMRDGAQGPALASWDDERFTRLGSLLAKTKLDELPQLLNVVAGQMSLVGPRPEDARFVELHGSDYAVIHRVRPGITGLSQLAFARESRILDSNDRVGHYVAQILPQKVAIDRLYACRRSIGMDLRILGWTLRAVLLRGDVAVNRRTGALSRRAPRHDSPRFRPHTDQA